MCAKDLHAMQTFQATLRRAVRLNRVAAMEWTTRNAVLAMA
jgi:hypothetical protein